MFNAFLYYACADVINMKENKKEAIGGIVTIMAV